MDNVEHWRQGVIGVGDIMNNEGQGRQDVLVGWMDNEGIADRMYEVDGWTMRALQTGCMR